MQRGGAANGFGRRNMQHLIDRWHSCHAVPCRICGSQGGRDSYTRSLALQLGPAGIRVNAVAPGLIYTRIWEQLGAAIGQGEDRARLTFDNAVQRLVPLGREQTPQDIGRTVAWLCSARAVNVTGQVVAIDGGITLGRPPLNRE